MAKKKSNSNKNNNSNKKNNNINKGVIVDNIDYDLRNKIIVVAVVVIFFAAFYFLAFYITNKNNPNKNKEEETADTFNYDSIVIGRSFDMKDEDYVVLYYDGNDEETSSTYSNLMSGYKNKDGHYAIYYVNMGNAINKSKSGEAGNASATNIDELTIAGPTLIHFSNGAIVEYVEGEEAITNYLS